MTNVRRMGRRLAIACWMVACWSVVPPVSWAEAATASGLAKGSWTLSYLIVVAKGSWTLSYLIVVLATILGLAVVLRPTGRTTDPKTSASRTDL